MQTVYIQHIYPIFYQYFLHYPVLEYAGVRAPVSTPVPRVNGRLEGYTVLYKGKVDLFFVYQICTSHQVVKVAHTKKPV